MQHLECEDVERLVRLTAGVTDPSVPASVADRKRMLAAGLAELVDADVWIWTLSVENPEVPGDMMATSVVDGGWVSDRERTAFVEVLLDPEVAQPVQGRITDALRDGRPLTFKQGEVVPAEMIQRFQADWRRTGLEHHILSLYPVAPNTISGIGMHRRIGRPPFTDRERAMVHVVFQQVDWLHRHGADAPANAKVLELTPRQRQVLIFLLGGDTQRRIAQRLELSEHTVGDYVKQIYRRLQVNSRAELFNHFLAGGQA